METVEVSRIQVFPCAYWNGLLRRADEYEGLTGTGYDKWTWPSRSYLLCWNCCHSFDCVPSFLPVHLDLGSNQFYFAGNFCSWNCVKSYAFRLHGVRKPGGASYISLLAFLTAHRPRHCLYDKDVKHPHTCPCIDMFTGVTMSPKKEVLKAFGGNLSVEEYRKDFLTIESYDWVEDYFNKNREVNSAMTSLTSTKQRRMYTFCFVSYPGPLEATVDQVVILPLTHRTLPKKSSDEQPVKKAVKPYSRSNPCGRRRFPKSNNMSAPCGGSDDRNTSTTTSASALQTTPAPAPAPAPSPAPTSYHYSKENTTTATPPTKPVPVEPAVSEEQAFYINSVNKYGNLFSSMGITIQKK